MSRPALNVVGQQQNLVPPHNLEAEQSLLGSILVNNQVYYKIFERITPDDFYDPVHGRIFSAMAATIDAGRVADPRTLRDLFAQDRALEQVGGGHYLADLAASVITIHNTEDYATFIQQLATRRRLLAYSDEVKAIAHDHKAPAAATEELIGAAETKLFALAEGKGAATGVDMKSAMAETMAEIEDAYRCGGVGTGLPTGIDKLTAMLGGFQSEELYVIAGRPSMGKTAMGLTLAANVAKAGAKVMFHSLEMKRTQIVARLLARETGIAANKQRKMLTELEFRKLYDSQKEIVSWPLYIDDSAGLKLSQIRGRAIRQKRRYGLDLLVIDYLGLMTASDATVNRNYQIEEITKGLKALAKELKITVVLLAQLNRELEKRDDKRPMLSDLRDSGAVEQDADVIMFLYRHEYYITRAEPIRGDRETPEKFADRFDRWTREVEQSRGRAELIIAKHRQGETGVIPLKYQGWRCHFFEETVEDME